MIGSTDLFSLEFNQLCKASDWLRRIPGKAKNSMICKFPVTEMYRSNILLLWTLLKFLYCGRQKSAFRNPNCDLFRSQWKSKYVSNLFPGNRNREGPGNELGIFSY